MKGKQLYRSRGRVALPVVFLVVLFTLFNTGVSFADGALGAILTDSSKGFRAEFSTAGTLLALKCDGNDVLCGSAFSANNTLTQGANENTLFNLQPSDIGGTSKWLKPYYSKPPQTYLTQTGSESGVAVFDESAQPAAIPDGAAIHIRMSSLPTPGSPFRVTSVWTHVKGSCKLQLIRKYRNETHVTVNLKSVKELLEPCVKDGTFSVTDGVVQGTFDLGDVTCHASLRRLTAPAPNTLKVGTIPSGDVPAELFLADTGPTFDPDAAAGNRWMEGFIGWLPNGLAFPPCCEKTIVWEVDIQCEPEPPGGGDEGECPTFPCPEYFNFWVNPSVVPSWPLSSIQLGDETYSKSEALALLTNYSTADASVMLGRQLVMTKLNLAAGTDPECVHLIILQADALLAPLPGKIPNGVSPLSVQGMLMWQLACVLDFYNRAQLTPSCDGEILASLPPPPPGNPGTPPICPLSQGYWKNHPTVWAVSSLVLGDEIYTKAELLALLSAPVGGDASIALAKQLIAAKLNIAAGADPGPISGTITAADTLLAPLPGKLPYGVTAGALKTSMNNLKNLLEAYNLGELTEGCGEE
jgi:hypothetical protein